MLCEEHRSSYSFLPSFCFFPPKRENIISSSTEIQKMLELTQDSSSWNISMLYFCSKISTRIHAFQVLYTDTGGGTGNMTRHRCPIGLSYRSSAHGWVIAFGMGIMRRNGKWMYFSSSTDTVEAGQQSSFESTVSGLQRITEQRPTLSLTINVRFLFFRGVRL